MERAMSCGSYAVFIVTAVLFFLRRFEYRGGPKFVTNMAAACERARAAGSAVLSSEWVHVCCVCK